MKFPETNTAYHLKRFFIWGPGVAIALLALISCSTTKNTSSTRAYHNLTAHYNVYFNANESLKSGKRKIQKQPEDYSGILPVFKYEHSGTANLVSSDMDLAIKKCAKTIKSHSITVKPKMNSKNLSKKDKDFMQKPDYCKWIDDAYLLMGIAHFYKDEFETAKQTFIQNINKYSLENTRDEAMLWLAKTYVATRDFKNAESQLIELRKNRRWDNKYQREIDLLYASMYLKQKDFYNATQKLNTALTYKTQKKEKPRLYFILAQIYQNNQQYQQAITNYKKVIKMNPNYDITFKSKINLAEIYEKSGGNTSELKSQLLKMLKDEKNTDYFDQLYYALGKIEQNQKKTGKAIEYYTLSSTSKSTNKTQKAKTYLALAELYYSVENFQLSRSYYDSAYKAIEPGFPDYELIHPKVKNYRDLTDNLGIIQIEDSLQALARLPETERNRIIDGIIQQIREEEKKAAESKINTGPDPFLMDDNYYNTRSNEQGSGGNYYFYNPTSVSYGQTEFKKRWGDRKLEDNWRRSNKQSVLDPQENIATTDTITNTGNEKTESKITNNKTREFYLQNIPLSPEKKEISDKKIDKAFLNSGKIYSKEFIENKKAIAQLEKMLERYPKSENRQEALQIIHTLYNNEPNYALSEKYKQILVSEYPESMYTKMLSDPGYIQKVKKEQDELEKIYQTAYTRYTMKEYNEAIGYIEHGLINYPGNRLMHNFIYLKAMAYGEMGNKEELKKNLQLLVASYPREEVSERARQMLDILEGRKFEEQIYASTKDSVHYFIFIYPKDKIDINKLRFKFISLNAKDYTQSDLKILVQTIAPQRDMLMVREFKNSSAAMEYLIKVENQELLKEFSILNPKSFIISSANYQVYLKNRDDEKYKNFFDAEYLVPR